MEKRRQHLLQKIYYDPRHQASFSGVEKRFRAAKAASKDKIKLTRKDVREWVRAQETYSLHKRVRKNFTRNRVFVEGIDDQFESDLADFQSMSVYNDNYRFVLVCIDCFSKYAWVRPLKSKTGPVVTRAFCDILDEG